MRKDSKDSTNYNLVITGPMFFVIANFDCFSWIKEKKGIGESERKRKREV